MASHTKVEQIKVHLARKFINFNYKKNNFQPTQVLHYFICCCTAKPCTCSKTQHATATATTTNMLYGVCQKKR